MESQLRVGDRVGIRRDYDRVLLPREGTIVEIKKFKGIAVIQWDDHDYLGFGVSTRTLDILRKVTA